MPPQFTRSLFRNSLQRAAPPGMKYADSPLHHRPAGDRGEMTQSG
jgi:hypothetical protein